ncbi:MAG TPA: pyrroloquinoline quinone biosynthesis peptide chaperone PqqD [Polyangia bacterium]|nr:pyrroloquinoline quinone biosynthesis peptide chaperone PqqD [Polyangia bacterium]
MISPGSRPRLAGKARLRFDAHSGKHLILYPERGLELTSSAAEIARRLGAGLTVTEIVDQLVAAFGGADRTQVAADVDAFLRSLDDRGLLARDEA